MQMMDPVLDTSEDFFHHSLSLVDGDLHHRSLAGRGFCGKLGDGSADLQYLIHR